MTIKIKYKIATYIIVLIVGFGLGFMTYAKFFDNGTTIKKVVNKVRGRNNKQDVDQRFLFPRK